MAAPQVVVKSGGAGLALFFSLLTLAMVGTNTYSILSAGEGVHLGYGMILFLIGSVGGMVGGFVGMTG